MLRLYSKGCEYALRGLMHCAEDGGPASGFQSLCRKARIPEHFSRKMFQKLTQKGLLRSVPGPNGGFRLARSPREISLRQIIEAIDGHSAFDACVMGNASCKSGRSCALHTTWSAAKKQFLPQLESQTLSDLIKKGLKIRGRKKT